MATRQIDGDGGTRFIFGRLHLPSKLYPAGFWKSRDLGVVLQKYESSLCSKVSCCSRSLLDPLSWVSPKPLMLMGWV
ncbi:hypothetical protein BDA96_08G210200 [Sorghum bicolor]|uniref:Uncharacterized protein n=1 Tax=Sorghum bicolor TaxID=4558 RepID=A0A921U8U5_SORBI|nr:hypothetical protein BDA96_08G210200 [Sorghum bicolor]